MCKFKTHRISQNNELFYADVVITNRLRVKINKAAEKKEPMWRRRLQNKIKELRKDLGQLESSKDKGVSNTRHWQTLERKYNIRVKKLGVVIEELEQRNIGVIKLGAIKDGQIGLDKTECFRIISGSFIGN